MSLTWGFLRAGDVRVGCLPSHLRYAGVKQFSQGQENECIPKRALSPPRPEGRVLFQIFTVGTRESLEIRKGEGPLRLWPLGPFNSHAYSS